MSHRTIHLFRKGLRLHDNPSLLGALASSTALFPVYVLDRAFLEGAMNVGALRWRFILQSLEDLDGRLRALGSRLYVLRGPTPAVLRDLVTQWDITQISYDKEVEPYYAHMEREIQALAEERGLQTHTCVSHTLYDVKRCVGTTSSNVNERVCERINACFSFPPGSYRPTAALLRSPTRSSCTFCPFWVNQRNRPGTSALMTSCKSVSVF